ncbi:NtaA/DmoA family FMN-dependent monooxygenase [Streptomyces abyssomicinicus]|uniref:NtaA/DmoA family FMN-dependent monooxygenase n=1 Tax=Streptomyces abyssomicinicus TaxID=574929 RepID=UPI00125031A6|nr:NtaA/DmoA family FMN-dependent monooxygenase [Streptomyces abyssomicinicus]
MAAERPRRVHLALSVGRPAGQLWRRKDSRVEEAFSLSLLSDVARAAEDAKFDTLFRADNMRLDPSRVRVSGPPHHLEPMVVLSALAARTEHIGLIGTASTTFNAPYTLARQFASLDHLSGGRAGWNMVTSTVGEENYGDQPLPPKAERYARAREFVEVAVGLWESWQPDALVLDRETGVFADETRIRPIRHRGEHFQVEGPLNIHRPPQGRPVLVQAGRSEEGRDFAATHADVIFAAADDIGGAQAFYADMKDRARRKGRDPESLKILLGTHVVLGATEADARALEREWVDGIDIGKAVDYLQTVVSPHLRLAELPLDEPIPVTLLEEAEALGDERHQRGASWLRTHHRGTLRQLAVRHRQNSLHLGFTGTPEKVAGDLAALFRARAADGFVLSHSHVPEGLELLTRGVTEELRRAGLFRHDYEGPTLRHHLGIA